MAGIPRAVGVMQVAKSWEIQTGLTIFIANLTILKGRNRIHLTTPTTILMGSMTMNMLHHPPDRSLVTLGLASG